MSDFWDWMLFLTVLFTVLLCIGIILDREIHR